MLVNLFNTFIESPIINASGCWCMTENELNDINNSESGAIVSKSSTLEPREGNKEPRFYMDDIGSINSMGAPNLGYEFYGKLGQTYENKPFIQSILPFSIQELHIMLLSLGHNNKENNINIELNVSCPNISTDANVSSRRLEKNKDIIGYDFKELEKYLKELEKYSKFTYLFGLKLPPYYKLSDFEKVSELLLKYSFIYFITCINSIVNGFIMNCNKPAILPNLSNGGIGGLYCKPTALANVRNFSILLKDKIKIIGCGGIKTGQDIYEYLLCGATAVQVGTELIREGPEIFSRLKKELIEVMKKNNYELINDFRGLESYKTIYE
jgi:dihydroorotate dehydrogenase (fumarate)